jgi:hypothetical protein
MNLVATNLLQNWCDYLLIVSVNIFGMRLLDLTAKQRAISFSNVIYHVRVKQLHWLPSVFELTLVFIKSSTRKWFVLQ